MWKTDQIFSAGEFWARTRQFRGTAAIVTGKREVWHNLAQSLLSILLPSQYKKEFRRELHQIFSHSFRAWMNKDWKPAMRSSSSDEYYVRQSVIPEYRQADEGLDTAWVSNFDKTMFGAPLPRCTSGQIITLVLGLCFCLVIYRHQADVVHVWNTVAAVNSTSKSAAPLEVTILFWTPFHGDPSWENVLAINWPFPSIP